jgi:hypothetical protein
MPEVRTILSEDFLGICLLAAGGDIDMSLGDIAALVEKFQGETSRFFGNTGADFRDLLCWLVYYADANSSFDEWGNKIDTVPLRAMALRMLAYLEICCNDEGEYWCSGQTSSEPNSYVLNEYFHGDIGAYMDKLSARQLMLDFFENLHGASCPAKDIQTLMAQAGITGDLFYSCSVYCL